MKKKNVAIVLSGCGHLDGTEIREAVLTLLECDRRGLKYEFFAPSKEIEEVDHSSGGETGRLRNSLTEAARISRGRVKDIDQLKGEDFEGLIFPGGFGAAKVLCDFAVKGKEMEVLPRVEEVILEFHRRRKPIVAICIAPVLLARVLSRHRPLVTVGQDKQCAEVMRAWGAGHENTPARGAIFDDKNRLATTAAYMLEAPLHEMHEGISKSLDRFQFWMENQS